MPSSVAWVSDSAAGCTRVHVHAVRAERGGERRRRETAVLAGQQRELRAAGEEARGAALVHGDVRLVVGEDRPVRRAERGERQRVGRGAGGHGEGAHRGAEELAERAVEALRPLVVAVGARQPVVGGVERREELRTGAAGVVAEESQGLSRH